MRCRFAFLLGAAMLLAQSVSAENAQDVAAAQALFDEGRRLLASGDYQAACEKFEASQKWDPGVGTLLNLADCYEKSGRPASAWAVFREAAAAAQSAGSRAREEVARDRARALEARLSTLTVRAPLGVHLATDGRSVDAQMLGTPIPIDPGKHEIEATAPGKEAWKKIVEVPRDPIRLELIVPELRPSKPSEPAATGQTSGSSRPADSRRPTASSEPAGALEATGALRAPAPSQSAPRSTPLQAPTSSSATGQGDSPHGQSQRILAVGAGVVGLAGLGLGVALSIRATSLWSDAKSHCASYLTNCDRTAEDLSGEALQAGNVATAATIVGIGALAGGALLWLLAPGRESMNRQASGGPAPAGRTVRIGVTPSSVVVHGGF